MRERKHDMDVWYVEDLTLPRRQPGRLGGPVALRTVPIAAGVITALRVATVVTLDGVAAEDRRATGGDGAEHPMLCARQGGAIPYQEGVAILLHHLEAIIVKQ